MPESYSIEPTGHHPTDLHGWAQLRVDTSRYVSFRFNGEVYFTSRKILIRQGEDVWILRNGIMLRGRCGNTVTAIPTVPTLPTAELEAPVLAAMGVQEQPESNSLLPMPVPFGHTFLPIVAGLPETGFPVHGSGGGIPPGAFGALGGACCAGGYPVVIGGIGAVGAAAAPEPGTWIGVGFGLILTLVVVRVWHREKQ